MCQVVVGKAWRVCQMVVVCQGDGEGMAGLGTDAAPAAAPLTGASRGWSQRTFLQMTTSIVRWVVGGCIG